MWPFKSKPKTNTVIVFNDTSSVEYPSEKVWVFESVVRIDADHATIWHPMHKVDVIYTEEVEPLIQDRKR